MTDEADVIETDEAAASALDAAADTTQDTPELDAEDRALGMGWTPKAQFKGDPEKWVDAETFVKRGEEFLPFLKANNKRLEKELENVRKDLKTFGEFHKKTAEREYGRALADLKAELAEASAAGDADAVDDISDRLADLKADIKAEAPAKAGHSEDVVKAWVAKNDWYAKDPALRGAAKEISIELEAAGLTDTAEQLAEVAKRIKAEFPEKFGNPRRRDSSPVEAGGHGARKSGKSRADLPLEARQFMDRMVKSGTMTEAEYLKDYAW